jgi:hypothetical protein
VIRRLESRWFNRDRRASCGDTFVEALSQGPLRFDELVAACTHGDVQEVAAWLGQSLSSGAVVEVEPGGPVQGRWYALAAARKTERRRREQAPRRAVEPARP